MSIRDVKHPNMSYRLAFVSSITIDRFAAAELADEPERATDRLQASMRAAVGKVFKDRSFSCRTCFCVDDVMMCGYRWKWGCVFDIR